MSKTFTLHCTNNLSTITTNIKETKKPNGTLVKFLPDYNRFGVDKLPKGNIDVLNFELLHIGMTYPGIKFTINGKKLAVRNLKDYAELYNKTYEISDNDGLKIVVMPSSSDSFEFVHFINGLNVFNGGTPLNWVVDNIVSRLHEKLVKKYKSITKGDIKSKLFIVSIFSGMYNPRFADQIKSQCVNNFTDFKSQIESPDFDKLVGKILKTPEIIDPITEVYKIKEELKKRQELKGLDKTVKKIKSDKYLPSIGVRKYLLLVEGESAFGGLSPVLGRKECGYYILKGKPLNAYSSNQSKFVANKELSELYKIIQNENYEYIIYATDQDLDGFHIRGLLTGFFTKYLPDWKGRIGMLQTPVIGITKKDKLHRWLYSLDEDIKLKPGEVSNYYKGLGSWDIEDLKYVVQQDGIYKMIEIIDFDDDQIIDDWLGDDSEPRKKYILENNFSIAKL